MKSHLSSQKLLLKGWDRGSEYAPSLQWWLPSWYDYKRLGLGLARGHVLISEVMYIFFVVAHSN